jgi:mannose-6-phosphate isomerase-like protein (cupin superfamily)
MQHMTPRELVRRWYGQINNQPPEVRQQLTKMVAHTVIPAAAMQQFGPSDYAPLSGCIDIVLHSEINTVGESIGTTIRGYRSSYDVGFNELKIGGVNNLLFVRDLSQRPHSEGKQRVINPDKESAVLLAALEMDAEREAALRAPRLQQRPEWAGALLAYPNDQAPKFEITEGVKLTALHYMSDNAPPLKALCAPQGYRGYLKRIIRHSTYGITMIELSKENDNFNDMDLVFEVPSWAQLLVEPRQDVVGGMPLAALTLPEDMGLKILLVHEGLEPFTEETAAHNKVSEHRHPFTEVRYVVSGELMFNISGNQFLLRSGDRVEIPANTKHWHMAQGEQACMSVCAHRVF